jgi:hypothetical protein
MPKVGGVAISVGYLLACDDGPEKLNNFVAGQSAGASAYYGVGGGYAVNGSGQMILMGVGMGQFSAGSSYSQYTGNIFTGDSPF